VVRGWSSLCVETGGKNFIELMCVKGIHEIDLLSINEFGLETLKVFNFSRFQPKLVIVKYGTRREATARSLAEESYSILCDDDRYLIAARIHASPLLEYHVPPTRNFTGLSGKPGYEEIQKEAEQRLGDWLKIPNERIERVV